MKGNGIVATNAITAVQMIKGDPRV